MSDYISIPINEFLNRIREISQNNRKTSLFLSTWDDGDYFLAICEENGGIHQEQKQLFLEKRGRSFKSIKDLISFLQFVSEIKYFSSQDGKHLLRFDVHLWIGSYYIVYNFEVQEMYFEKIGLLKKIVSPMILPKWQS